MQARISEITEHPERSIKVDVVIDIYNGISWHGAALTLIAENVHEGARIGLIICDAIDKAPDIVLRKVR